MPSRNPQDLQKPLGFMRDDHIKKTWSEHVQTHVALYRTNKSKKAFDYKYRDLRNNNKLQKKENDLRNTTRVSKRKDNYEELSKLLKEQKYHLAWRKFYDNIQQQKIFEPECVLMLDACLDSAQMNDLIHGTMKKLNLIPSENSYEALIMQLLIEGNEEKANDVFKNDMVKAGLEPNPSTRRMLDINNKYYEQEMDHQRYLKLQQLTGKHMKHGASTAAVEAANQAAWTLFDTLGRKGLASTEQYEVMMRACHTSKGMLELHANIIRAEYSQRGGLNGLLGGQPKALRDPNNMVFNIIRKRGKQWTTKMSMLLHQQYELEGNLKAAETVLRAIQPKERKGTKTKGTEENKDTDSVFREYMPNYEKSAVSFVSSESTRDYEVERVDKLESLIKYNTKGSYAAAWSLFDQYVTHNVVNDRHVEIMLPCCMNSKHISEVLQKTNYCLFHSSSSSSSNASSSNASSSNASSSKKKTTPPMNVSLLSMLLMEGKYDQMRDILEQVDCPDPDLASKLDLIQTKPRSDSKLDLIHRLLQHTLRRYVKEAYRNQEKNSEQKAWLGDLFTSSSSSQELVPERRNMLGNLYPSVKVQQLLNQGSRGAEAAVALCNTLADQHRIEHFHCNVLIDHLSKQDTGSSWVFDRQHGAYYWYLFQKQRFPKIPTLSRNLKTKTRSGIGRGTHREKVMLAYNNPGSSRTQNPNAKFTIMDQNNSSTELPFLRQAGALAVNVLKDLLSDDKRQYSTKRQYIEKDYVNANDAHSAAFCLLDTLIDEEVVTLYHFNAILKSFLTSTEMRQFINCKMNTTNHILQDKRNKRKAGEKVVETPSFVQKGDETTLDLVPDVVTYTTLVRMLLIEGDTDGVKEVIEIDMKNANVQPDAVFNKVLADDLPLLPGLRTQLLRECLIDSRNSHVINQRSSCT
jgi:pentatricopeptide repeat protein